MSNQFFGFVFAMFFLNNTLVCAVSVFKTYVLVSVWKKWRAKSDCLMCGKATHLPPTRVEWSDKQKTWPEHGILHLDLCVCLDMGPRRMHNNTFSYMKNVSPCYIILTTYNNQSNGTLNGPTGSALCGKCIFMGHRTIFPWFYSIYIMSCPKKDGFQTRAAVPLDTT